MISSTASRGVRRTRSAMTWASLRAGMMRVAFVVVGCGRASDIRASCLGRAEDGGAGAARLQKIAPLGGTPVERDSLAADQGAIGIRLLDPAGQLAAAGTAAMTRANERAADAGVGQSPHALELWGGEHPVGACRREVLDPEIGSTPVDAGNDVAFRRHAHGAAAATGQGTERLPQYRIQDRLRGVDEARGAEESAPSLPELLVGQG